MGTYFHGNSEIHGGGGGGGGGGGDGLQTLVLMNTGGGYVGFSESPAAAAAQQQQPGSNYVFFNSQGSSMGFSHAPTSQAQQYVAHPFGNNAAASSSAPPEVHVSSAHDFSAFHGLLGRPQYSLYAPVELAAAREVTRSQQGLSLSLSSQQTGFGNFRPKPEAGTEQMVMAVPSAAAGDEVRVSGGSPSSVSDGVNGGGVHQNLLLNSKFLNAAQELLDEVVNVGRGMKSGTESFKGSKELSKNPGAAAPADVETGGQSGRKRAAELTTAERQEIQMKKSKLVNMLDEVEQRYRQYHHQMQVVIAWFEQAAGVGSSRTYTSLALQTISKQFRCLKDAILGQIRAAGKSLGEEIEGLGGKIEGSSSSSSSSRLRFVDNHLRQQRALQQLGMIQHNGNAWRPQRGLPERSVSVLRAWLFEHFLHPYPKDSDKIMLAKQTGLTRNQVSNWFINARVRLWKPMVEEMYLEETKEQEQQNNSGTENQTGEPNEASATGCSDHHHHHHQENTSFTQNQHSPISTSPSVQNQPSFSPKKTRRVECPDSAASFDLTLMGGAPANFIGGFESYPIGQIGSYSGNAVSLTLGLPHSENLAHQGFIHTQEMHMGRGVEMGEPNDQFGSMDTPMGYNIEDRKRFAAPLLPDFVA